MSNSTCYKTDIFPNFVTDPAQVFPLEPLVFQKVSAKKDMGAFITFLTDDIVRFKPVPYNSRLRMHFEQFEKHFHKLYKQKQWSSVAKRLSNDAKEKKNIDCRLSFKYNLNFFLVKRLFTTGLREVEKGTVHCYCVGPNPIVLYTITNERIQFHGVKTRTRSFDISKENCFKKINLEANTTFIIPSDIFYVVCTYTYAYFAIYIIPEDAELSFQVQHIQVTREPKLVPKKRLTLRKKNSSRNLRSQKNLDIPVNTPYYDDVTIQDSEEESSNHTESFLMPPPSSTPEERMIPPSLSTPEETMSSSQADSFLMPPPSTPIYQSTPLNITPSTTTHEMPPSTSASPSTTIHYQLFRLIPLQNPTNRTTSEVVQWYNRSIKDKIYHQPIDNFSILDNSVCQPLDLRTRIREESNPEPRFQDQSCQFPELDLLHNNNNQWSTINNSEMCTEEMSQEMCTVPGEIFQEMCTEEMSQEMCTVPGEISQEMCPNPGEMCTDPGDRCTDPGEIEMIQETCPDPGDRCTNPGEMIQEMCTNSQEIYQERCTQEINQINYMYNVPEEQNQELTGTQSINSSLYQTNTLYCVPEEMNSVHTELDLAISKEMGSTTREDILKFFDFLECSETETESAVNNLTDEMDLLEQYF